MASFNRCVPDRKHSPNPLPAHRHVARHRPCADLGLALLDKSGDRRTSPFPAQTYPTTLVTGMPRAVRRFNTATPTWNSATCQSKSLAASSRADWLKIRLGRLHVDCGPYANIDKRHQVFRLSPMMATILLHRSSLAAGGPQDCPYVFGRTRAALLSAKAARRARASGWVFTTPATTASA
jgi:hypothetical protein